MVILRNAAFRWIAMAVNLGVSLCTTPLLVRQLGESGYGAWSLVISVGAFLGVLDLGISSAVDNFVASDLAAGNRARVKQTVDTALFLFSGVALVVLGVHLVLAFWARSLFNIPADMIGGYSLALVVMGLSAALGFPARIFEGCLWATERHYLASLVEGSVTLGRLLVVGILLLVDGGLLILAAGIALLTLAGNLACLVISSRLIGELRTIRPRLSRSRAKEILAYGRDSLAMILARQATNQGPVFILGVISSKAAAHFAVGMRLVIYSVYTVLNAAMVTTPRFAALRAKGDREGQRALLLRSLRYTTIMAGYVSLGLGFLCGPFVRIWVGPAFKPSAEMITWLLPALFVIMVLLPCESALLGLRRHRRLAWVLGFEAVVTLAGSAWLAPSQGVVGIAWAMAAGILALRPWAISLYTCRLLELSPAQFFWRGPAFPLLGLALSAPVVWWVLRSWNLDTWLGLVSAGLVITLIHAIASWLVGLNRGERRYWLDLLASKLKR